MIHTSKEKTLAYKTALNDATKAYHRNAIAQSNQKELFSLVNSLTVKQSSQTLPTRGSSTDLAKEFSNFYDDKIRDLHLALDAAVPSELSVNITEEFNSSLSMLRPLSRDDVLDIIKGSKVKSCSLDPIPASVFKIQRADLLPTLTTIVNMSLQTGVFPSELKKALVRPSLKKPNLDPETLKHYRPISNLAYLGKLIERAAVKQYVTYLSEYVLFATSQSAYRQHHSTETALLRVCNDILRSLDSPGGEAILVLLDLTAAFDTIDHSLLLERLQRRFGLGGNVIKWFASYLHRREQSIVIDSVTSDPIEMVGYSPRIYLWSNIIHQLHSSGRGYYSCSWIILCHLCRRHSIVHHNKTRRENHCSRQN